MVVNQAKPIQAYFESPQVKFYHEDAISALRSLPNKSINCCVTSPPYYRLRDYGHPEQIGMESMVEDYIKALVEVFDEVLRVLTPDGTCWLNIGDSYAANGRPGQSKFSRTG